MITWKFVDDVRKPVYPTLAAELDAIRAGKKPISFFATDRDGLHEDHEIIQAAAAKRDLEVNVAKRGDEFDIFVHRAGDGKRVPKMLVALSKSPWNFEHEEALGKLLGYTAAQRKEWLAAERHARPAFGVLVLYGSRLETEGAPDIWFVEPGRVVAHNTYAKRPRNQRLWRVGVNPAFAKKLDRDGIVKRASPAQRKAFRDAVRTDFECFGPKGWQHSDTRATK